MRYCWSGGWYIPTILLAGALASGCGSSAAPGGTDAGPGAHGGGPPQGKAHGDGPPGGKADGRRPALARAAAPKPAANQVVIDNFTFDPPTLTVAANTKVTWVNRDDVPHTATSTAKPRAFDSKTLDTDEKFSHVFKTPGTYEYYCAVHPRMTGRIIVK